jgi:hypothetical protein
MTMLGNEDRLKKFQEVYETTTANHTEQLPLPHFFASHYSSMGIVSRTLTE